VTDLHDKLKKLLNLSAMEGGATEAERDAAMMKAQDIAFRYNIDLQAIEITSDDDRSKIEKAPGIFMETWEGNLFKVVATVNFCDVFYFKAQSGSSRKFVIYGKAHNIDASMDLFMFLRDQLQAEATREVARRDKRMQYARKCLQELARELIPTAYMRRVLDTSDAESDAGPYFGPEQKLVNTNHPDVIAAASDYLTGNDSILKGALGLKWIMDRTGLTMAYASEIRPYLRRGEYAPEIVKNLGVWRSTFYAAATWRISDRLQEHFKSLVDDSGSTGTDLVVNESAALKEFADDLSLGKADSYERKWDTSGYNAGRKAGDNVSIHQRDTLENRRGLLTEG
jgi:hypothetical protein